MISRYNRKLRVHMSSLISVFKASVMKKGVVAGYYNVDNFGDLLTPDLLKFSGLTPYHTPKFRRSHCVGVGSILHLLNSEYSGAILGSGFIQESDFRKFPSAKVMLVRGRFTRAALLGESGDCAIGDPGLLVDEVYGISKSANGKGLVGVVPHYKDAKNEWVSSLVQQHGDKIKIIDVRQSPEQVIGEIAECDFIASSSLHGVIVADSLGIPSVSLKLSDGLIGGDFKFRDYYSCFDESGEMFRVESTTSLEDLINACRLADADRVADLKSGIRNAYKDFAKLHLQ